MTPSLLLIAALLQTTEVAEPNSHVKIPIELQAQVLTGTGIRTRTIAKVKVYAFGLYVDQAGARSALGR